MEKELTENVYLCLFAANEKQKRLSSVRLLLTSSCNVFRILNTPPPSPTPPLNMLERFLSVEPDFADGMRATAALNPSASNWGG